MLLFISAAKLYVIWPTIHLYLFGDNKSISEVSPDCVLYVRLLNLSRSIVHVLLILLDHIAVDQRGSTIYFS
jgi:hypothetical protein